MATKAETILQEFRLCEKDEEIKPLIDAFRRLSLSERQSAEGDIIHLLEDETQGDVLRSWTPTLLGAIGSESAKQFLICRLPIEKNDLFRRWISTVLVRYFQGDDRILAIMHQLDLEKTQSNRNHLLDALIEARHPLTFDLFLSGIQADQGDYAVHTRMTCVRGLKALGVEKGTIPLVNRLTVEPEITVKLEIVEALEAIRDPKAVPALTALLQDQEQPMQFHIAVLQAMGKLGSTQDKSMLNAIVHSICYPNRITAFTATDTLLQLLPKQDIARLLTEFGLQQANGDMIGRVADALRVVGSEEAIHLLKQVRGDLEQENRARLLLEQMGGKAAMNVLIERRLSALNQAKERVRDFDKQALQIFESTIAEPKKGFTISLWMSGIIFTIGVILLVVSIFLVVRPNSSAAQQLFGAGGALAGLGSILAMFYKGPMKQIEKSVANLIQIEIVFLGYIRQVTQITAIFEREYLDNENFGLPGLKNLLEYTEHCVKETMPLVNRDIPLPASNGKPKETTPEH